ncbi:MAG: alpha/beta hydrolase [Alphaproteobacteria bacterium]|nr:MAG: alpha/beta hydrolase [Alphaproteobacteria bacterium]
MMRAVASLLLALALAHGAWAETGSNMPFQGRIKATLSGFTDDHPGSLPKRNKPYETIPDFALPDPARATVVIYSHGTSNSQEEENCSAPGNDVPPSLRALTRDGVYIWYLCSRVALRTPPQQPERYVLWRMEEVADAIEMFLAAGVRPERLFLAGHSAGGWTSLMMARDWMGRLGGIIAYAPAFAGTRADARERPEWRGEARPRMVRRMLEARRMRALVFAYEADEFNRPQELRFLTDAYPDGVRMIRYHCDDEHDHASHVWDCRLDLSTEEVRRFVLGDSQRL